MPDELVAEMAARMAALTRHASERWLRDSIAHAQENDYTERVLGGQLADELEAEMAARVAQTDEGVPQRVGQFWTYWYRLKGQQYRVHARLGIHTIPCASGTIRVIPFCDWALQSKSTFAHPQEFSGPSITEFALLKLLMHHHRSVLNLATMPCRRMVTEEFAVPTEDDVMDRSVPGEVVLDENVLAEGHVGFSLEGFEVLHILALNDSPALL